MGTFIEGCGLDEFLVVLENLHHTEGSKMFSVREEEGEDENAPQAREDGMSGSRARTTLGFSFDCAVTWPGRAGVGEAGRGRWTGELEHGVPKSRSLGGAGKELLRRQSKQTT